jgi:hypothetical protein
MPNGKHIAEDCDHLSAKKSNNRAFLDCFKAKANMTYYLPINQHQQRLQQQVQYTSLAKWATWHFYHHQTTAIFTY